jgi:hypothetical protein
LNEENEVMSRILTSTRYLVVVSILGLALADVICLRIVMLMALSKADLGRACQLATQPDLRGSSTKRSLQLRDKIANVLAMILVVDGCDQIRIIRALRASWLNGR